MNVKLEAALVGGAMALAFILWLIQAVNNYM